MVEGTRSLLKDAILSDPPWALQDPMKQGGSPKLRSGKSVPTPFDRGLSFVASASAFYWLESCDVAVFATDNGSLLI